MKACLKGRGTATPDRGKQWARLFSRGDPQNCSYCVTQQMVHCQHYTELTQPDNTAGNESAKTWSSVETGQLRRLSYHKEQHLWLLLTQALFSECTDNTFIQYLKCYSTRNHTVEEGTAVQLQPSRACIIWKELLKLHISFTIQKICYRESVGTSHLWIQ